MADGGDAESAFWFFGVRPFLLLGCCAWVDASLTAGKSVTCWESSQAALPVYVTSSRICTNMAGHEMDIQDIKDLTRATHGFDVESSY